MKRTLFFSLIVFSASAISVGTVAASQSSTLDDALRGGASVLNTIDVRADRLRPMLVAKKNALDVEIDAARTIEGAVVQSVTGAAINGATGAETVKPSRAVGTPSDTLRRIGLQIYLGLVLAALFILDHKIILYLLIVFFLYKIFRAIFHRFFTREA